MRMERAYVEVVAAFDAQGRITPLSVALSGRMYEVDRVLDRRMAAATKAGGQGMRYTVRVAGKQTYLFLDEEQRWFVEKKTGEGIGIRE